MSSIQEHFEENGYYLARGVFDTNRMAELTREFDKIVARLHASGEEVNARWGGSEMNRLGGENSSVLHTHNVHQYSGLWLQAFLHARHLDIVEEILGPDIILHHSKLFQKIPKNGSPFPMHQDWSYFPTINDNMIAAVIHVSDATDEMGCLRVYPGSHKLGRVEGTSGQSDLGFLDRYPLSEAVPIEAHAGDVVYFHYFTLHGSMPNRSALERKTVLVQMYAGDDKVENGNPHPDERLVLRGWNHCASRSTARGRLRSVNQGAALIYNVEYDKEPPPCVALPFTLAPKSL